MEGSGNQNKDYENFFKIFYKYEKQIYYEVKSVLRDEQLAEDAVQEVGYRILKYFHRIEEFTEYERNAYIKKITRSAVTDILRQNRKFNLLPKEILIEDFANHQSKDIAEDAVILNEDIKALKKLSKKHSRILTLRVLYGFTFKEIAGIEKITESTARKRFERVRKKLKNGSGF